MSVLVVGEHDNAELNPATLSAITAAAAIDADVELLIAGSGCGAVAEAAAAGRIDATTWNLMTETPDGFRPLLPDLSKMGRWLSVSAGDIERINAGNTFTTEAVTVAGARLLSFRQALSAWSATADAQVVAILHCLGAAPATAMRDWPGLRDIWVHPAALKFYRRSDPAYLQTRHPGALEARITEQERTEYEP